MKSKTLHVRFEHKNTTQYAEYELIDYVNWYRWLAINDDDIDAEVGNVLRKIIHSENSRDVRLVAGDAITMENVEDWCMDEDELSQATLYVTESDVLAWAFDDYYSAATWTCIT